MELTDRIRKIRIEKGYSQEYMALQLGQSQNAYSKLERGETQITWDKLERIAEALGVSLLTIIHDNALPAFDFQKRIENLEDEVRLIKSMLHRLLSGRC